MASVGAVEPRSRIPALDAWPAGLGKTPRPAVSAFGRAFQLIALLVLGGMAALAYLLTRLMGGDGHIVALVWVGGCGLAVALPLLAVALAVAAFRGIATPLAEVMSAADAVAGGDLGVRLPVRGRGDFGRLAASFNHMIEELAHADQQRRNLTADVAHELRNPLHVIQGNLEGILDGVYAPTGDHINATLDETRALARLVEDLRTLSLAEAGQLPHDVGAGRRGRAAGRCEHQLQRAGRGRGDHAGGAGRTRVGRNGRCRAPGPGVEQPGRQRAPPHAAAAARSPSGPSRPGLRTARTAPGSRSATPARGSRPRICLLSSIASGAATGLAATQAARAAGWDWPSPGNSCMRTAAASPSRAHPVAARRSPSIYLRPRPPDNIHTSGDHGPDTG